MKNEELLAATPWIDTASGDKMPLYAPSVDKIHIYDIAHSLSLQCRFNGNTKTFYSVAEHSVRVAYGLKARYGTDMALWGLLHDASEAYLGDIARPIKVNLGGIYKALEQLYMECIARKFNLTMPEPYEVKEMDNIILLTERRDLLIDQTRDWGLNELRPISERIVPWTWEYAKQIFLDYYEDLTFDITHIGRPEHEEVRNRCNA